MTNFGNGFVFDIFGTSLLRFEHLNGRSGYFIGT